MDGDNNVINFRWERLKHRFRHAVYNVKRYAADFFGIHSKSHAHDKHSGKGAAARRKGLKNL